MKEINIGNKITAKRREKGITQGELASYIGVSKASVSKWETGQSYPDITFLPQLATYFNISIDELIGYSPQMSKEDIKMLYRRLAKSFAREPWEKIMAECRAIIKKYYSCWPLLFEMAVLLVNHHMLAGDEETRQEILEEACRLCQRIIDESEDIWLVEKTMSFQAVCYIALKEPKAVLDLLEDSIRPLRPNYEILAQAYQMLGNGEKAVEMLQISLYQYLLALIGVFPGYLVACGGDDDKREEILRRALSVASIFNVDRLQPNAMIQIYLTAATLYGQKKDSAKTLAMLEKYTDICCMDFSCFSLEGDDFFDKIDDWLADLTLGANPPREERLIKEDMYNIVVGNPVFAFLAEEPQYKKMLTRLKRNQGGN